MAKKQKRQVAAAPRTDVAPKGPTYAPTSSLRRVTATAEFKPDYTRVVHDLKRIAMLAGSFFVILIVLSFFLR
ncbi:MAG: hypothetical protein PHQ40_06195 [Anaerolineaceae bacterium]|nr:hypothetical protein [Anaerolineaceae bacterium]